MALASLRVPVPAAAPVPVGVDPGVVFVSLARVPVADWPVALLALPCVALPVALLAVSYTHLTLPTNREV